MPNPGDSTGGGQPGRITAIPHRPITRGEYGRFRLSHTPSRPTTTANHPTTQRAASRCHPLHPHRRVEVNMANGSQIFADRTDHLAWLGIQGRP